MSTINQFKLSLWMKKKKNTRNQSTASLDLMMIGHKIVIDF
jgi:hypothetical protein